MSHEPWIEQRAEGSYAGIAGEASDEESSTSIDRSFPELFGWLGSRRRAREPRSSATSSCRATVNRSLGLGVPTGSAPDGDGPVQAGTLPAGRYATFLHVGPYRPTSRRLSDPGRG